MKNITLSMLAIVALSSVGFAETVSVEVVEQGANVEAVAPVAVEAENTSTVMDGSVYAGLGISVDKMTLDFTNGSESEDKAVNITLLAGYNFSEYVAVEGRYMTSVAKDDNFERDTWGIYVKPQYPVSEELKIYALLGYGSFEVESIDADDSGFQWGLGVSYAVAENVSIFVDYTSIANDVDADALLGAEVSSDAITAGITYRF